MNKKSSQVKEEVKKKLVDIEEVKSVFFQQKLTLETHQMIANVLQYIENKIE